MNRRTFVQTGVMGAFGLALNPAVTPFDVNHSNGVVSWLKQFSGIIGAKRFRASNVLSAPDLQKMQTLDQYFAQRFFHRESGDVFVAGSHLFYPVFMRQAGLRDVLLPVFKQQASGCWEHIGTFSGFQLEALVYTAKRLMERGDLNASALLPLQSGRSEGAVLSYECALGTVSLSTIIREKAVTQVRVWNSSEVLLETSFDSAHCLQGSANV